MHLLYSCFLQVAANTKGIQLVQDLIAEHSLEVVQAYMKHIQANAGAHSTFIMLTCLKQTLSSVITGTPSSSSAQACDALNTITAFRWLLCVNPLSIESVTSAADVCLRRGCCS